MGPVWALLLLLLPIAQGAEPVCDARQNNALCYGAVGGNLKIRLMDNGSMKERCKWTKNDVNIFEWRNNRVTKNELQVRSEFFNNTGIFLLRNLSKNDTDSYTLEYIGKDSGLVNKSFPHKIIIEAPVSSLHLQHQCLSKGEVQVTWTSEGGDSPEFSCSLNGHNLTDAQLLSKDKENKTIILRQNTEGLLRCSVRNHVSEEKKELQISSCGYIFIDCMVNGTQISVWVLKANNTPCIKQNTTSAPITSTLTPITNQSDRDTSAWLGRYQHIIAGAVTGVLVIGLAAIVLICVLKKKKTNNNSKDEEHDLTYADVSILKQPGRRPQQRVLETEVEYGQVKFTNQKQNMPEAPNDASIYAKVRR